MPILEDEVKAAVAKFLRDLGYESVEEKRGTRQGYDVEGRNPKTQRRLVVECKGEAMTGNQLKRSWVNVSSALLTSLNEVYAPDRPHDVAAAFPDTPVYRGRLLWLQHFLEKEKIRVFWVKDDGSITEW